MKWLKRKLAQWVNEYNNSPQEAVLDRSSYGTIGGANKLSGLTAKPEYDEHQNSVRFSLTSAVGGRIINVSRYDPRTDRNDSQVYVIPSGEDVGERVAKIINIELMK